MKNSNRNVAWISTLSLLAGAVPGTALASNLQCQHLPLLFAAFLREHYSVREMTEQVRQHTIAQFIKRLDPSKTLLLEADVTSLKKDLPGVFQTMSSGECGVLNRSFQLMVSRAKEDLELVRKILGDSKFKLDESISFMADPDKRGYAKTSADRQDLLRKMVHFQIANYLMADQKLPDAKKQLIHRYELIIKRLTEMQARGEPTDIFAEAFATSLDPHSTYMSQETLEEFQIEMRLALEGIGASLSSQDGFTVIEDLIPGGSAERLQALRPKDKIMAVAQEGKKPVSTMDMDLRDVVKMIRGKKGTKVILTILRQSDKTETFDVTIVRDKIDIKEQAAKISYETREINGKKLKIGVLELPSFYGDSDSKGRSSYRDVKRLLEEAKKKNVDGIVLDLSRNGGGLLEDAVRISGLFVKKGGIVATRDTQNRVQILADEDEETVYSGPLVVLTSHLSASASEILAGALKDYDRALIVGGDRTFGKGTVQVVQGLPANLGAMKVTVGMFFRPGGKSTQHIGVNGHIALPSLFNNNDVGEKAMDYSLAPQSITPFLSKEVNSEEPLKHWKPVPAAVIAALTEKSQLRVSKSKDFAETFKEIEESAKNKGTIRIADLIKKSKKENGKKKKAKTAAERKKRAKELEEPYVREAVNILVDWIGTA